MELTCDVLLGISLKRDEAAQCAIDQLPGHNVLGWLLKALRDDQLGRGAEHLITLYQANRNIPFYEGITFLYGREPVNLNRLMPICYFPFVMFTRCTY